MGRGPHPLYVEKALKPGNSTEGDAKMVTGIKHIGTNLEYGTRADVSDVVNVLRRRRGGQLHRMIINLRFGRNFAVVWTRLIMEGESVRRRRAIFTESVPS